MMSSQKFPNIWQRLAGGFGYLIYKTTKNSKKNLLYNTLPSYDSFCKIPHGLIHISYFGLILDGHCLQYFKLLKILEVASIGYMILISQTWKKCKKMVGTPKLQGQPLIPLDYFRKKYLHMIFIIIKQMKYVSFRKIQEPNYHTCPTLTKSRS